MTEVKVHCPPDYFDQFDYLAAEILRMGETGDPDDLLVFKVLYDMAEDRHRWPVGILYPVQGYVHNPGSETAARNLIRGARRYLHAMVQVENTFRDRVANAESDLVRAYSYAIHPRTRHRALAHTEIELSPRSKQYTSFEIDAELQRALYKHAESIGEQ